MKDRAATVVCGRFQPFETRHRRLLERLAQDSARLIVLCGSAQQARDIRSPWGDDERRRLIGLGLGHALAGCCTVLDVPDVRYDDRRWAANVLEMVGRELGTRATGVRFVYCGDTGRRDYSVLFPTWECHSAREFGDRADADRLAEWWPLARETRRAAIEDVCDPEVAAEVLAAFETPSFQALRDEYEFTVGYRAAWAGAPYPPVFVTVDAVVVCAAAVLLIERDRFPGKGRWALPGGFIDPLESLDDAVLRELAEETALPLSADDLHAACRRREVFDAPHRSFRGRIITFAYLFELDAEGLPEVRAGDDARRAKWFGLHGIDRSLLFEDHYAILQQILNLP